MPDLHLPPGAPAPAPPPSPPLGFTVGARAGSFLPSGPWTSHILENMSEQGGVGGALPPGS